MELLALLYIIIHNIANENFNKINNRSNKNKGQKLCPLLLFYFSLLDLPVY